jgi:hypothetical protein
MFFCFFRNFMPGRCDVLACAIDSVARAQEGRSSEKNNQASESDSELLAHKQPFSRGCAIRDLTIMKNRVRQSGVQDGMARPSPCLPESARHVALSQYWDDGSRLR